MRQLSLRFKSVAVYLAIACMPTAVVAQSQSLFEEMRNPNAGGLSGYVFVSSHTPEATLISLARDARRAGMIMVLNGYGTAGPGGLESAQRRVAAINEACCQKSGAHWQVNPMLFQRYKIAAVPAFVIARGAGDAPGDFSKVSGEMPVGSALKFFAQQSRQADIRQKANEIYVRAFSAQ